MIVAGLFRDRDRALRALDELRQAGFGEAAVTIVGSPTSAAEVAREAARELERPPSGLLDFGAAIGGQAEREFPEVEARRFEERVAQIDTLLRVEAPDRAAAERVEAILLGAGAEQVIPGTMRD